MEEEAQPPVEAVPLELQRRIVNTIVGHGAFATVVWLALGYAGVALIAGSAAVVGGLAYLMLRARRRNR